MLAIQDSRVIKDGEKWRAKCVCQKTSLFATKNSALLMLERGSCRNCKKDYRNITDDVLVYKNANGKWCSTCASCGTEQAYTRKDHAKQSEAAGWRCRKCVAEAKGFSENLPVGNEQRLYNKFRKSANVRKIPWEIDFKDFVNCYTGKCSLTGWDLSMCYTNGTASFDRIDSDKPYEIGNVQWVHTMVNMCKNKYDQNKFIEMCRAIADKVKW